MSKLRDDNLEGLMMSCDLPGELMMDILSRLPIKSLLKFTSVCKAWRALVQNQAFVDLHFHRSISIDNEHYLITRGNMVTNLTDTFFVSYNKKLQKVHLSVGVFHRGLVRVVGSCHGLICTTPNEFTMCGNSFIIYNPAIHEFKEVFKYRRYQVESRKSHHISTGFGYDSRLKDYKIVRVEQYEVKDKLETFYDVYLNSSDSWRQINANVNGILVERISKANVAGAFHWLAKRNDRAYILSFDISDEVFGEMMLPKKAPEKYFHLNVWKERLALIYYVVEPSENMRIEIWRMKVYGLKGSWVKEHVNINPNPGFYLMLASRDNGQYMFINKNTEKVYLYDPKTNQAKYVAIPAGMPGSSNKQVQVVKYKESLISVNRRSRFQLKKYPSRMQSYYIARRHVPAVFIPCWWFCTWMISGGFRNLISWLSVEGLLKHVRDIVVVCLVVSAATYCGTMFIAFVAGFIQFFGQ